MGFRTYIKKKIYNLKYLKKKNSYIKNKVILVTGASSGIGLGICKRLIKENLVIGISNNNEKNLQNLDNKNLVLIKCDLSNLNNYDEIEKCILKNDIELIINCAGQFGSNKQSLEDMDFDNFVNIFRINSLSILKILQLISVNNKMTYLKKVINISSDAGSLGLNSQGNAYIYRITKSALNSISKNLSIDLKNKFKISVITIDPGNVKSNMNNKGYLSPEKCSEYLLDIISDNSDYNGLFINLLKKKLPW
jgi:short-subunit dehydrogenase